MPRLEIDGIQEGDIILGLKDLPLNLVQEMER